MQGSAALGAYLAADSAHAATAPAPKRHWTDPLFNQPYVDVDEWRDTPIRHRYVHGGFKGTDARFVMQFPPKEQYRGRFFQYLTAVVVSEMQAGNVFNNDLVGFCVDSGAIAVVSNQGGLSNVAQLDGKGDGTIGGYRASASVAMYARELAAQMYGPHRTYGYAFGGSGGGYRTISGAENTSAWDGVVPFIHGNLQAWPNSYAGRARAQRTLKARLPSIADAMEPGGGDPYASLSAEEAGILREVTRLGFPIRTWVFHESMGIGPLSVLFQGIQTMDPGYFNDFWKLPGYLGHDHPESFDGVRIQHRAQVRRVILSSEAAAAGLQPPPMRGQADPDTAWRSFQSDYGAPLPVALELESAPPAGSFLAMANINVVSGASTGRWLVLGGMQGNIARLQFSPAGGALRDITEKIRVEDAVQIDNSNILAYETYYRHALLTPDYYVGNQFRQRDGTPVYPQRPRLIAHDLMAGATPTIPNGKFDCKMIVVENLVDWDAHAWYADWYRTKVREHLGTRFGDNYRLWYTDYATHGAIPDPTRVISYSGALQQALRDVAAWVEHGVAPPRETNYRVADGQVIVPPTATARRGIQPVVTLQANGAVRANVKVGEAVTFTARVEAPPGTGLIVAAEWDFAAGPAVVAGEANRFGARENVVPAAKLMLSRSYSFAKPGTYFPALRVHSQRQGDASTAYARMPSLGRVRVIVT